MGPKDSDVEELDPDDLDAEAHDRYLLALCPTWITDTSASVITVHLGLALRHFVIVNLHAPLMAKEMAGMNWEMAWVAVLVDGMMRDMARKRNTMNLKSGNKYCLLLRWRDLPLSLYETETHCI